MTAPQRHELFFEEVFCNLCGASAYEVILESTLQEKDLSLLSKEIVPADFEIKTARLVRCHRCKLCYANPRLRPALLGSFYNRMSDPDHLREMPLKLRSAKRYLREFEGLSRGRRLLDVGCYTGFFLKAAKEAGWQVAGLEPSGWAARYAREVLQLPVVHGTIEEAPFDPASFDVITLFQVLEHVADPRQVLSRLQRLLAPRGLLVIEVPDINSLAARLLKGRWWLLKPSHHYYFSRQTLSAYLEEAGFEIVKVGTAVNRFGLGHLAVRCQPYLGPLALFLARVLAFLRLDRIGIPLDLGDLLLLYARKKGSPG